MMARRPQSQKYGCMKLKKRRSRLKGRTRKAKASGIFKIWDEEGESFQTVVGVPSGGNRVFDAVDRWLREAKFFGATSVSPTASVYGSQMYPSSLLSVFSPRPDSDLLRAMLIDAERYGLRVMPQLSPRADEILMGLEEPGSRLLVSRTGQRKLFGANQELERPPLLQRVGSGGPGLVRCCRGRTRRSLSKFSCLRGCGFADYGMVQCRFEQSS